MAFLLSDTNVSLDKKIRFTLTRKWFWMYVLLLVLTISTFLAIGQVLSFVAIRNIAAESDWGKREPEPGLDPLKLPVVQVIVVDTADEAECCPDREECIQRLRAMQLFYKTFLKDIPFNFMIGCDGTVYVGRGFESQGEIPSLLSNITQNLIPSNASGKAVDSFQAMANEDLDDENTFVIAFIGNFSEQTPQPKMLQTFTNFLSRSVARDMIAKNYSFTTQNQLDSFYKATDALTVALSVLPHFNGMKNSGDMFTRDQWLLNTALLARIDMGKATAIKPSTTTVTVTANNNTCFSLVTNKLDFSKCFL